MANVEAKIRAKQATIAAEQARLQQDIAKLQARLSSLESQRQLLDDLLVDDGQPVQRQDPFVILDAASATPKMRPVDGIVSILSENPDGMTGKAIQDKLLDRMETNSANPRAIIRNTLHNLVKQNKIVRDETTGVYKTAG